MLIAMHKMHGYLIIINERLQRSRILKNLGSTHGNRDKTIKMKFSEKYSEIFFLKKRKKVFDAKA